MPLKALTNTAHDLTQPIALSIGSAVMFGITVDDMLKLGTLALMCLNIPLAAFRIYKVMKSKDEE